MLIEADLPGLKKDDVKINFNAQDGILEIQGKREEKDEKKEGKWIRRERRVGQFYRSFPVGSNLDPKDIKAKMKEGVLQVCVPCEAEEEGKSRSTPVDIEME